MMPKQLQAGLAKRRRTRRAEPRPIAECLKRVDISDLPIPKSYDAVILSNIEFRYPGLSHMRLAYHSIEATHCTGRIQAFPLRWHRTGLGRRPYFVCTCQRAVTRLYLRFGSLACRRCANAVYASQTCSQQTRPALQATRLRRFFDSLSDIGKPFPAKPKSTMRRKTYHRLKARALVLEAKSNKTEPFTSKRLELRVMYPQSNFGTRVMLDR